VYIQERATPRVIQGLANNLIGITGTTIKGPVDEVVLVDTFGEFLEIFGGRDYGSAGEAVVSEVWRALVNRAFGPLAIVRAAAAAAATAEADFVDTATPVINIAATSPGAWGAGITVTIADATDGNADHFNLTVNWNGQQAIYRNLDISTGNNNLASVIGDFASDRGLLIVATKLADGRPDNAADQALDDTTGADGSIADADFTGTDGPLEKIATYRNPTTGLGCKAVFVAGQSTSAIKAKMNTLATASSDRVFLACPDDETVTKSAAVTEVQGLTRDDRLVYVYNHYRTLDPETATLMWVEPHGLMASILSQRDDDIHPGDADNASFASGVIGLAFPGFSAADYDTFTAEGIAALERTPDGFVFADAPSTDRSQLAYRLMKDYIIRSLAALASDDVKKANTPTRRIKRKGDYDAFLGGLADAQRFVDVATDGTQQFRTDLEILNTPTSRATGLQRDLVQVRLVPFALWLKLEVEIGTTVTVREE
jgi:hypothetical protein